MCGSSRCCYEQEEIPTIESSRIIIVDFSFPSSIIKNWLLKKKEIILIDHHITAWEELHTFSNRIIYKYDLKECGATLTWKHFFPDKNPPAFLKYIKDRDLWDFLLPETPFVHEAMGYLGRSFTLFDKLEKMEEKELIGYLKPIAQPLLQDKLLAIETAVKVLTKYIFFLRCCKFIELTLYNKISYIIKLIVIPLKPSKQYES